MSQAINWDGGRLVALAETECRTLLHSREVARVAWCTPAGPFVLPVNYAVTESELWIRTTPYGTLARACDPVDGVSVAVEVDELDTVTRRGWSVVVRGRAHTRTLEDLPDDAPGLVSWAGGARPLLLAIGLDEVTGRRLLPG